VTRLRLRVTIPSPWWDGLSPLNQKT